MQVVEILFYFVSDPWRHINVSGTFNLDIVHTGTDEIFDIFKGKRYFISSHTEVF